MPIGAELFTVSKEIHSLVDELDELVEEVGADFLAVVLAALLLYRLQHGQAHRARHRVPAKGVEVKRLKKNKNNWFSEPAFLASYGQQGGSVQRIYGDLLVALT